MVIELSFVVVIRKFLVMQEKCCPGSSFFAMPESVCLQRLWGKEMQAPGSRLDY